MKTTYVTPQSSSAFSSTKRDKREIKRSTLLAKVQKSAKKPLKRRRPSKKLVATLESLADALPDLGSEDSHLPAATKIDVGQATVNVGLSSSSRMKSLKSRPGAMKRKAKLERAERERFSKNLAIMATTGSTPGSEQTSVENRWEALKRHVAQSNDPSN